MPKIALLLVNNGVWLGEQVIPQSYVQAIKNITTTSVVTGEFTKEQSYGLKFWSIYGDVCIRWSGPENDQKCDLTIPLSPQGFDGQYMLMDFTKQINHD